jgi:sec-independent protein translocase protein TatC
MPRVGPVSHEDRLTLVEHLDELRSRLIVSLIVLGVVFALCFWQNHLILDVINKPLPDGRDHPITFGVAEPFTTTVTVSAYAAILISMPLILYQLYAFVLPAFKPQERKVALPLLMLIPVLFIAGVVFGYFVVLPAAVKFLLNFNDTQFNIQVRAKDYYSFVSMTLIAMGLVFQVPVGILAITKLGITTPEQLAKNRRYAWVICAVVAAALPGTDPVSMLIEMVPLLLLFEGSLVLARFLGRPRETSGAAPEVPSDPSGEAA